MQYHISVVIPNYNGLGLLQKNLPSVVSETLKYNPKTEIIVVDDGSTDESVLFLNRNFPKVKVIKHSKNKGFSSAVNSGIRAANGDLVVFLNNDVFPEKDYLSKAVKHFEDDLVFAVSFHEKGYGWAKGYFNRGFVEHKVGGEGDIPHITFWVNGGSGVFRKRFLKQLGCFDEKLFSPFYWEDIDLSYRAVKRGWKLLWEPGSIVVHEHESTVKNIAKSKRNFIIERNQLLFIWKNITSRNLIKKHIRGLFSRLSKHPGYIRVVIASLLKLGTCLKERRKELRETTVSDEMIFANFDI